MSVYAYDYGVIDGAKAERERITKLIFDWGIKCTEQYNWNNDVAAIELIGLINGAESEKK